MTNSTERIAERIFVAGRDGERPIKVMLFAPTASGDGRSHLCRYSIDGLDQKLRREAGGADSLPGPCHRARRALQASRPDEVRARHRSAGGKLAPVAI
jgi:hypothetical protein